MFAYCRYRNILPIDTLIDERVEEKETLYFGKDKQSKWCDVTIKPCCLSFFHLIYHCKYEIYSR